MGLPLALLAVIAGPVVAVIVLLFEGAGGITFEILFITLLQRATPEDMLTRVFGLQDSVTSVAQLLGSLAAPLLVAGVKLEATLWIGGGLVVVAAALLAAPLNRLSIRSDVQRRRYTPPSPGSASFQSSTKHDRPRSSVWPGPHGLDPFRRVTWSSARATLPMICS